MHLFTFAVRRTSAATVSAEVAGAYVNCWIEMPTQEAAEQRARALIEDAGWRIESLDGYRVVTEAEYPKGEKGREYFNQALIDGEVLVFNCWPRSGEDTDLNSD